MSKNTGKDFEKLIQEIYQAFCDFDCKEYGLKTILVQHNVKIKGKSGTEHQIDVFWKFNVAGVEYNTLIEAKDWKSPVKKEQLLSLKSKIDDIPNSNGIFVSKSGFQEGAKIYAEYSGIQLITITEGANLKIALNLIKTNYENLQVVVDKDDWQKSPISIDYLRLFLYDESYDNLIVIKPDKYVGTIFDLMCIDAEPYYYDKENLRHHIKKDLDGEWYIISNKCNFPMIRIYGYSFYCYNTIETQLLAFENLPIVCIENILDESVRHYNKDTQLVVNE